MSITDSTLELGSGAIATVQVARQPILTAADSRLLGYQLLFSDNGGLFDAFVEVDGQRATSEVLGHAVLTLGIDSVVGDHLAFVAFPRQHVLDHVPLVLPPGQSVIQLGRDCWADPTDELAQRCRDYTALGYRIALADVTGPEVPDAGLAHADFVVVDVAGQDEVTLSAIVRAAVRHDAQVIAAGVDDEAQRGLAIAGGAGLLQGFHFSAPHVVVGRELPGFKLAYLQLLRATFRDDVDFDELADIIKQDVALSYKLLKYINSAHFGLRGRIDSVQRAVTMLGLLHIRSWVGVATVTGLVGSRPQELAVLCATRARFCETLGRRLGIATPHEGFSLGMFSLLDVLLGTTLDRALADVPLSAQVREALEGQPGELSDLLVAVVAYERGHWDTVSRISQRHGWPETELIGSYIDAVEWSRDFFGAGS
jgi:EAL and modified HD-GYP domain-containing signal transduction protein